MSDITDHRRMAMNQITKTTGINSWIHSFYFSVILGIIISGLYLVLLQWGSLWLGTLSNLPATLWLPAFPCPWPACHSSALECHLLQGEKTHEYIKPGWALCYNRCKPKQRLRKPTFTWSCIQGFIVATMWRWISCQSLHCKQLLRGQFPPQRRAKHMIHSFIEHLYETKIIHLQVYKYVWKQYKVSGRTNDSIPPS